MERAKGQTYAVEAVEHDIVTGTCPSTNTCDVIIAVIATAPDGVKIHCIYCKSYISDDRVARLDQNLYAH